jgi:hypothetical protein
MDCPAIAANKNGIEINLELVCLTANFACAFLDMTNLSW